MKAWVLSFNLRYGIIREIVIVGDFVIRTNYKNNNRYVILILVI
jgi:hypothetical protein